MVVSHAHLIVTSLKALPPEKYPQNMGAIDVVDMPISTLRVWAAAMRSKPIYLTAQDRKTQICVLEEQN